MVQSWYVTVAHLVLFTGLQSTALRTLQSWTRLSELPRPAPKSRYLMFAAVEHSVFSAGKSTNSSTISHSSHVTGSQVSLPVHTLFPLASTSQSVTQLSFLRWGTLYGTFLHFFCWKSLYSALQALSLPLPE